LFKTECNRTTIFPAGPDKTLTDIKYPTAGWVDWYHHRNLPRTLGMVPPDELVNTPYAAVSLQEQPV